MCRCGAFNPFSTNVHLYHSFPGWVTGTSGAISPFATMFSTFSHRLSIQLWSYLLQNCCMRERVNVWTSMKDSLIDCLEVYAVFNDISVISFWPVHLMFASWLVLCRQLAIFRALDKGNFSCSKILIWNANPMLWVLKRIVSVSTHNIGFGWVIRKILWGKRPVYSLFSSPLLYILMT